MAFAVVTFLQMMLIVHAVPQGLEQNHEAKENGSNDVSWKMCLEGTIPGT